MTIIERSECGKWLLISQAQSNRFTIANDGEYGMSVIAVDTPEKLARHLFKRLQKSLLGRVTKRVLRQERHVRQLDLLIEKFKYQSSDLRTEQIVSRLVECCVKLQRSK